MHQSLGQLYGLVMLIFSHETCLPKKAKNIKRKNKSHNSSPYLFVSIKDRLSRLDIHKLSGWPEFLSYNLKIPSTTATDNGLCFCFIQGLLILLNKN